MTEAKKKPAAKKPAKDAVVRYINDTTNNVYTSAGRCAPGQAVVIPAAEADKAGLTKE